MADIHGLDPAFDTEVELTPSFRTNDSPCNRRGIVNAASFGQVVVLKAQQPVPDGNFVCWIIGSPAGQKQVSYFLGSTSSELVARLR
jgi:hypothetical protein